MTNWSQNKLVVTGNNEAIRAWKKQCLDQTFVDELGTSTKAFTWENLLPDIKGDTNDVPLLPVQSRYRSEVVETLIVEFLTAWDPPTDAIEELSTLFPALTFTIESKENDFHCIVCFRGGETLFDEGLLADEKNRIPSTDWVVRTYHQRRKN